MTTRQERVAQYEQFTDLQHVKEKSMWAGAKAICGNIEYILTKLEPEVTSDDVDNDTVVEETDIVIVEEIEDVDGDKGVKNVNGVKGIKGKKNIKPDSKDKDAKNFRYKFVPTEVMYSPVWYKCIDEIIVNAIDQWTKTNVINKIKDSVKTIKVDFNVKTGAVSVFNDGRGIEISKKKTVDGREMYIPQFIFSEFKTGTNLKSTPDSITGGTNGYGSKIVSAFSQSFEVETVDLEAKLYYHQKFEKQLEVINPPTVISLTKQSDLTADQKKSHTTITFLPVYKEFGYAKLTADILNNLLKVVEGRVYQVAAFLGNGCKVYFNNKQISFPTFSSFAEMFLDPTPSGVYPIVSTTIKSLNIPYEWDICIGLNESNEGKEQVSLINGIYVKEGGSHINYLMKEITGELKPKVEKLLKAGGGKFKQTMISNNIFIFMRSYVCGTTWGSQTKVKLSNPEKQFESYKIPVSILTKFWSSYLEEKISTIFIQKEISIVNRVNRNKKIVFDKYREAERAGTRDSHKCLLLLPEGDSADLMLKRGVSSPETKLTFDYIGIYNLQGVIMNARKESDIKIVNGQEWILSKEKLKENVRLKGLELVLGLQPGRFRYAQTPEGDKEFKTLRYGGCVACVDQDKDGVGNIFSLLLNYFERCYPNLIKRGYVQRMITPVIRVFPKTKSKTLKVLSFYSEHEYEQWKNKQIAQSYSSPKFYKGLAGHNKQQVTEIFKNFESLLKTYTLMKEDGRWFEVYFGKNADLRKQELSIPVEHKPQMLQSKNITCTDQLRIETKLFQLDNIERKIPHCLDGLNVSRRKVIAAGRIKFKTTDVELKVFQYGGYVAEKMHYHHGEASLSSTIITMAQCFPGARLFPYLREIGEFGSRNTNGKDHGQPRYIDTKLNKKLTFGIFPEEDDAILEYVFEDGHRAQPKYYVPVVPIAIMENVYIPATGWNAIIWARDFFDVLKVVREMIKNDGVPNGKTPPIKLNTSMHGFKCDIRKVNNQEVCVGRYVYNKDKNQIIVTELPFCIATDTFVINNRAKEDVIDDIVNNSTDTDINIIIKLKPEGLQLIQEQQALKAKKTKKEFDDFDVIEEYLSDFKQSLKPQLNFMDYKTNILKSFESYKDVLLYWYPARKELYKKRIERQIILLRLRINYLENIIRFVSNYKKLALVDKTEEQSEEILAKNKYVKFNKYLLENPGYISNQNLYSAILGHDHNQFNMDMITDSVEINDVNDGQMDGQIDESQPNDPTQASSVKAPRLPSYDYLHVINVRDMYEKAITARADKLAGYKSDLHELETNSGTNFTGSAIWLKELDNLEAVVKEGRACSWDYEKGSYMY